MRKHGAVFEYALKLAGVCAPVAWLVFSAQGAYAQAAADASAAPNELVQTYCVECHNSDDWAGSLDLDSMNLSHPGEEPEVWETAIGKLRGRLMPPAGQPQPGQDEVDAMVAYLETEVDASANANRVGHVPIQRLNRTEFAASVEGLIGVRIDPQQALPADIEVEGFNNIAGALGISPSFMEQYLSAARSAARKAVGEPVPKMASTFFAAGGGTQGGPGGNPGQNNHRDGFPLGTRGGMSFTHVFPADGEYRLDFLDADNLNAGLYPFGMLTEATMVILVDGVEVARRDVGGEEDLALTDRLAQSGREAIVRKMTFPVQVKAGTHQIAATYIERSWAMSNDTAGGGRISDMPVIKGGMQVVGPFSPQGLSMSDSRSRIFVCQPELESEERACAENIAQQLATKAFRRPVTDEEIDMLMSFFETARAEEGSFDAGVSELVTAVLSSPDFLFRSIQAAPEPEAARPLNDLELASRLSFFLWSQGPDEELITLATEGKLVDPVVVEQQVARMLKDPRAQALVENFALAWLNLDELEQIEPLDPGFNVAMRGNFETEMRLFLASVLLEDRSVHELLNADYTFVNDALARHYGIPGVLGPQFRQVKLADENRWGLLGKGAVLLRTSYGDRTSPVLRGAWVLDRIMGTPPSPPPPNVETDLSIQAGEAPTTVRARLEKHRENPTCQGCHGLIDPPGLALENFDVTGRWRDVDPVAQAPIDATTVLTSGVAMNGPIDLRHHLMSRPDQFPTTVTKRLMMYALNREIEYFDMPRIRQIVRAAAEKNYSFSAIVNGIVNSDAFRNQGGEEPMQAQAEAASETAALESKAATTGAIAGLQQ
jgi:mono/diheme cytochrome c family protein